MKKISRFLIALLCWLFTLPIFLTAVVSAAPMTISYVLYGRNSSIVSNFLSMSGKISLDAGDFVTIVLYTKYYDVGIKYVDVALTLSSPTNSTPFDVHVIEKKQTVDLDDSNSNTSIGVFTPRIYFNEPGTYPITAEIENLTTGGITTFRFTVVVMGDASSSTPPVVDTSSSSSSPPSSSSSSSTLLSSSSSPPSSNIESGSNDDSSEPILPPDPVDPAPPDPPSPYQSENDPLWLDLVKRLSGAVSGLFSVSFNNLDANYLPTFVAEALIGKDISLLINHLGNEYAVNGLSLARVYAGADIPFTELPIPDAPIEVMPPKMDSQFNDVSAEPSEVIQFELPALEDMKPVANAPTKTAPDRQVTLQSITLPYRAASTSSKTKTIDTEPLPFASDLGQKHLSDAVTQEQTPHSSQKRATIPVILGTVIALFFFSRRPVTERISPSQTKLVVVND